MSALLLSEDDRPDIQAAIERRDPAAGPGFFDNAIGAGLQGFGRAAARLPLTMDWAYKDTANAAPDTAGMDPLRLLQQSEEEGVPAREIVARRQKEIDDNYARSKERIRALTPDPRTTGMAGQILNSLTDYGSQAVVGSVVAGPVGAMALIGAQEYAPAYADLTDEGVDTTTASKVAGEQSLMMGAMAAAPAAAPGRLLTRAMSGAAINVGLGGLQRGRAAQVLREAGYGDVAERYKVLDAQSVLIDGLLGAGFGALHSAGVPHEAYDAAMVAQDAQRRDTQSPFGLPINNEADRQIAAADARAMEQIANGDPVDVADIFDEGRPVTLDELDAMQAPYEAPEEIVQSFLSWQKDSKPEAPMTLMEFVKSKGGLKTKVWSEGELKREVNAGEIESLGRYPGLVNNRKGMHPDDMARAAWEAGYMGDGADTWNIDDLFRLLREETAGNKVYPSENADFTFSRSDYDATSREAARLGIRKNTSEERVRELLAQSEYAQQRGHSRAEYAPIDPHVAERAELESIFADVRDEIAQVLGDEEPTDWMASRGGKVGFREGSKLRDFIIDRATGLTSEEIALDYGIETTSVASAISKFRTRVEERVKSGDTLDQIAQEMRITLDVLQKSLTDQKRKAEARDVVLRFARKDLSNAQIAERMRSMGFEKTTTESVTVMKSQLRRAGHDIPKGVGKPGKTDFLTSRGEAPIVATPKSDLETALARSFGKSSQKLLDTGKVEVLNSISELNAATGREFPADTKAVNGRGKTFVVAENVSPSEARGILLHEVGVHHGMADMLGEQGMARLKVAMDALLASGNPAVQEARALAEGFALKPEHVEEETLAYLVEHHPDMPIVRRLLAQIRQWLWRAFPDLVDLTPDDLAMMAVASLRRAANADMRTGFSEWMTSFGGALATKEGRARWAATGLQKATEGNATTYAFDIAGRKVEVGFVKKLGADDKAYYDVDFDFARGKDEAAYQKEKGGFGSSPADQFGKIVAAVERFVSEHSPEALTFSGNTESLSRLYSRMALSLRDENTRVFEQTNPENGKVQFIIAEKGYDPKAEFPRAKELDKPLSAADMAARTDAAKNDAVARYLDWFRESGGDEMRASRGKKRDTEMNDPVKAAIAEDPSMKIPDEKGELHPVNEALIKADEIFKNAKELSKGFEAAGACAARHAASMVTQAELRTAELVGGFAWGAATAGAIANVAAPAIMEANNQAYADDLQRRADADRAAIAEDRAQFIKENPVTSIPIGRSLDNTIMHAADRTGVPENFLSALIRKESGGDAKAKSATSSATGMTQFVDATWRNELLRVGPKLGFKGDPYSQEALDLRKDPRWAVMVAAEYAKANAQDLKAAIGRDPTHGEVYLAHFMGLRGAIDLINAADQGAPSAAALFPSAAAANQNVFHGSAKDVLKRQTKGFSNEPFVVNQ